MVSIVIKPKRRKAHLSMPNEDLYCDVPYFHPYDTRVFYGDKNVENILFYAPEMCGWMSNLFVLLAVLRDFLMIWGKGS